MDYGLIALIILVLVLVAFAFHAWRGIRSEADRITGWKADILAQVGMIKAALDACRAVADAAAAKAGEVEVTHYKTLLRRIDEAEAVTAKYDKQVEALAEKQASVAARVTAIQRHYREQMEAGAKAEEPQEMSHGMMPLFQPPESQPDPRMVPGHFGRKISK